LWTLDGLDAIDPATVISALDNPSRDVRVSALRISERWLGDQSSPVVAAVLKRSVDTDPAVRRQLAATLGELKAGPQKEDAIATLLVQHGDDPITVDAALSGVQGSEPVLLDKALQAAARFRAQHSTVRSRCSPPPSRGATTKQRYSDCLPRSRKRTARRGSGRRS
jgi:hypothetical protein